MDSLPYNLPPADLDPITGIITYKGQQFYWKDFQQFLKEEQREHSDYLHSHRDPTSDIQNLWGNKKDRFRDDWFRYQKRLRRPTGLYPLEAIEYYEEEQESDNL